MAVKQILSGEVVKANASVANPEALEWFRDCLGRWTVIIAGIRESFPTGERRL